MVPTNNTKHYFDPREWLNNAISFLRQLDRDPDEIELATFTFQTLKAAHICEDENDWIILTNRIIYDANLAGEFVFGEEIQHFRKHTGIRRSFDGAIASGSPRILNIEKLAKDSGASIEDVKLFVKGRIKREELRGTEWEGEHNLRFEQMTLLDPGYISGSGDKKYYPHAPLMNLYEPLKTNSESGAWGSVNKHRLLGKTVWEEKGTEVAIKIIPKKILMRMLPNIDLETAEKRVIREFQIGRIHNSPLLARSHDVFKIDIHGNDLRPTPHYVIVMDYINGRPLCRDVLYPMCIEQRLRIANGLTRAVAEFHRYGVHRDIKPGNAILRDGSDSDVVLIDYGIAKRDEDDTITNGDANFAALYASPQQIDNPADEDRADDIYQLGLSLAEIVLLRKPFSSIPRPQIYSQKTMEPFRDNELEKMAPEIANLVQRMTAPMRKDRPTMQEVIDVLTSVKIADQIH